MSVSPVKGQRARIASEGEGRVRRGSTLAWFVWVLALAVLASPASATDAAPPPKPAEPLLRFEGSCDATAVVQLADGRLLVGSRWDNRLRFYSPSGGGLLATLDVYPHTHVSPVSRRNFSAIEAAARLGERIYWISSHSRDRRGENRPNRRRFFAVEELTESGRSVVRPIGETYKLLAAQVEKNPLLKKVGLAQSVLSLMRRVPHLAPHKQGFVIQGLAAGREGKGLLVALRNPRPANRALLLPIENPSDVINGVADVRIAEPIRLDLGGRGISSLEYSAARGGYLLLAARHDRQAGFELFEWSGAREAVPARIGAIEPADFDAGAMMIRGDGKRALVLSDDSALRVSVEDDSACRRWLDEDARCLCSQLTDGARKSFRGRWIDLPSHTK